MASPTRAPRRDWFYLSFATDEDGFLGGIYTQAGSDVEAYFSVTLRKLNPGGEVAMLGPLPLDEFEREVPPENLERLLTKDEVLA